MKNNLDTVHIPVSDICNNMCIFCLEDDRLKKPTEKEVRRMLEDKKYLKKVNFTSGEPLLNRNIIKYIKIAKEIGYEGIFITTNGRGFSNKKFLKDALSAGLNRIILSFHGHNKEMQESLTRSAGSFEEAYEAIRNISDLKKSNKLKFEINAVLTRLNYEYIDEIYKLLSPFNIDEINFRVVQPRGFAKQSFDIVVPKYSDICRKFNEYEWFKRRIHVTLTGIPLCTSQRLNVDLRRDMNIRLKLDKKYIVYKPKDQKKLESCKKCKFYDKCDGIFTEYLKHYGKEEFEPLVDAEIKNLKLELNSNCNNNCIYCYIPEKDRFSKMANYNKDYFKKALIEFRKKRCQESGFYGWGTNLVPTSF